MTERNEVWSGLLRRANRGDSAAYARFLTEATPVIRRIVSARAAGEDTEDLVQEVLLAIHAKRHTWREDAPVTPWLYAIARYKAADALRRRRARPAAAPLDDHAEALADERAGEPGAQRDLSRLLDGVDSRSAAIVRAMGLAGESAAEVGERMGMTDGAVRTAYHRALRRLRQAAGGGAEQ